MKWTISNLVRAKRVKEPSSDMVCTPDGVYVYWSDLKFEDFLKEIGNPSFVFDCFEEKWEGCDLYQLGEIIEESLSDFYESGIDDVNDLDGLLDFVKEWNKKQTKSAYYVNKRKIIILDERMFKALIGESNEK